MKKLIFFFYKADILKLETKFVQRLYLEPGIDVVLPKGIFFIFIHFRNFHMFRNITNK